MDTLITMRQEYTTEKINGALRKYFSQEASDKYSCIVDNDKTNEGVVSTTLRDYYKDSISRLDGAKENVAWVRAYLIKTIVEDKNFSKAYKDRKDLANDLKVSKSTISNAVAAVRIREELIARQFGNGWSLGQIQELISKYNEFNKNKMIGDFWAMLKDAGLCNSLSAKGIRQLIKDNFTFVTEKEIPDDANSKEIPDDANSKEIPDDANSKKTPDDAKSNETPVAKKYPNAFKVGKKVYKFTDNACLLFEAIDKNGKKYTGMLNINPTDLAEIIETHFDTACVKTELERMVKEETK